MSVTETGYAPGSQSSVVVMSGTSTPESFMLMPNPGTVSGTVTDTSTGDPISGAMVGCTGTLTCAGTTTAPNGTYNLGLQEGSYQLTASASGYSPENETVNVGPGGTPTQNFTLVPLSGTISGTVFQSDGVTPINGATVACTGTLTCTPATTGSSGTYTLSNLSEGTYQITASMTGFAPETLTIVVEPGATLTGQNFQLAAAGASLDVAQSFGAATSVATNTLTITPPSGHTGAGDLLVVVVRSRTAGSTPTTVQSVTDSSTTDTWIPPTTPPTGPPPTGSGLIAQKVQADEEIWYSANAASVTSVTVTMNGNTSLAITVLDITGASANPLDQKATNLYTGSGSTTPSTGTTPTTSQASEIVVAAIGWNGANIPQNEKNSVPLANPTSGYTPPNSTANTAPYLFEESTVSGLAAGEETAWVILNATGAQGYAGTLQSSVAWTGVIATFQ